jgi:P-aminobenzoate N-oxygenase AurF
VTEQLQIPDELASVEELELPAVAAALADWHDRAGVRNDPRRLLHEEELHGLWLWPAALAPHVDHPLVQQRGAELRRRLLAQQACQYLEFTANYETRVINPATEVIANGRLGVPIPRTLRLGAYKIYCDEAFHALTSVDTVDQLISATGYDDLDYDFDATLAHLEAAKAQAPANLSCVVTLLVAVVFETLVTASLSQIPRDKSVVTFVRQVVRDHAHDESRHHLFFSRFFGYLWGQLRPAERRALGPLLPEFVVRPLLPRLEAPRRTLLQAGLSVAQVDDVLAESYADAVAAQQLRHTARATLKLFGRHNLYDDPATREAFQVHGLIEA